MAVSDHSPEAVEQRAADLQRSRDVAASIDHGELFRQAMAPEPAPEQQPQAPSPQPPEQPLPTTPEQAPPAPVDTRQRDEHGRFLPRTPEVQVPVAPAAATQQQPPVQPVTPEEAMIPSWRLREERERREEIAQQLAQERQARMMWEQQMLQARQAAQQPEPVPDMVTDPAGYHAHMQRNFQEALRNQEANVSFRLQHMVHGDDFMTAYNEMLGRAQRGDPRVVREVMASPDPGARMMEWYREARTTAMLGQHDPVTWATQVWLPEVIKNPQARAQIAQMLQTGAAPAAAAPQASGQAPTATYQVPPSLSRVPGAAANGTGGDMSDASLFAFAMRGR